MYIYIYTYVYIYIYSKARKLCLLNSNYTRSLSGYCTKSLTVQCSIGMLLKETLYFGSSLEFCMRAQGQCGLGGIRLGVGISTFGFRA